MQNLLSGGEFGGFVTIMFFILPRTRFPMAKEPLGKLIPPNRGGTIFPSLPFGNRGTLMVPRFPNSLHHWQLCTRQILCSIQKHISLGYLTWRFSSWSTWSHIVTGWSCSVRGWQKDLVLCEVIFLFHSYKRADKHLGPACYAGCGFNY